MVTETEHILKQILKNYNPETTINLLQELIRIPSHKQVRWQEDRLVKFILKYLEGYPRLEIELDYIEEDRPNLIVRLPGQGGGRNLLFNGHTDTIPPYNMIVPPYEPRRSQGYISGRGSVDMKGSLAAMLSALVLLLESEVELAGDLIFSGVIDQEQRSLGTSRLVEQGLDADFAIVGEPTDLQICHAHKGMEWYRIVVKGVSAHGSTPEKGQNTIYHAARIAQEIEKLNQELMERQNSLVSAPTINVGVIGGGDDPNIVPNIAYLEVDRRYTPTETRREVYDEIERLLARLNSAYPGYTTEVIPMEDRVSPLRNTPLAGIQGEELVKAMRRSVKEFTQRDGELTYFRGWSDAALLTNRLNIPSLVFGPGLPEKCHSGDESLKITDLIKAVKIYLGVALEICC
ncbi:MAG: M20 family metallopeptidase [Bacillota bacterium]